MNVVIIIIFLVNNVNNSIKWEMLIIVYKRFPTSNDKVVTKLNAVLTG